ncbi:LysR family transcriptional regulator [Clostridium sp. MCC353]|uniref:LysR family transcriptional regulator n=1 Tax=Clostridium sp. MCC353 TaxID=2592646 RepID=UPI001C025207|nr:LysR family transcriptional regulator [Clostridium sp. MCC353]MBT9778066.1 LysR family transcriptional regulator [Clostridium sp. MCC353]
MDVKYLNYIIAIAKKRNMTKAAEELYVSQSSLSQYLTKLEQEVGTPLFYRAKGELTLTPAGELYVKAAEQVIHIQKDLYKEISGLDQKGHITVGVTSQFALRMLSTIIPQFKKQYPEVTIEISETNPPNLTKMLVEENIDLGIMAAVSKAPFDDQMEILRTEEVYFAIPVGHPFHKDRPDGSITYEDFVRYFHDDNFLLAKKGSSIGFLADQIFAACHFKPSGMLETNSILTTRSMVASGVGVTFIADSCATDREHVAYYSMEPKLTRYNAVVRRKNWVMSEPEQVFYGMIRDYFNDK